jgi:ribonuclease BN (tRNA processing enzyme)
LNDRGGPLAGLQDIDNAPPQGLSLRDLHQQQFRVADEPPFPVEALPLRHSSLTLGYRIAIDGRIIAYCPDTGYCENAVTLAREADLLITECSYKKNQSCESWPHLNPETAARIACEARTKRLVLTHFDASVYQSLPEREEAEALAARIFPLATAGMDGLEFAV